jgi:hypothetical protein
MVRVAARIGLRRRPRDVTPSVAEYVAQHQHRAGGGGGMRPTLHRCRSQPTNER